MITIFLSLKKRHLVGASERWNPSKSALATMFTELPGVRKAVISQSNIILYGIDQRYDFPTPIPMIDQERKLYQNSTYTSFTFTINVPEWVHPDWELIEEEELPAIGDVFTTWWKRWTKKWKK